MKQFLILCALMTCSLSHSMPPEEIFMATLAQIGLKLNEDPCLPLETSQRTLQIAQEHIALMHHLIAELDPDSYLYTYTETLIIGQQAIISYITKQMQEEIDTPKQQDIANE